MTAAAPRVVLLGCGRWGGSILRDLLTLGCAVTVVDPAAPARAAAAALGAQATLAAFDGRAVDGVVIATPTSTHGAVLAPFLAGAVPVFVEKPLCADADEARRIQAAARAPLRTMEKWRYHPAVVRLAALAADGALGALRSLRTRRLQPVHRHADVDALWTLAPHDLAIARAILGRVPPLRQAWREGDEPDAGVTALFADPGDAAPRFTLEVSARRPKAERGIILTGADGSAWFDDRSPDRLVIRRGTDQTSEALATTPPLLAELRAFVAWLAGGAPPAGTLAEAVETVGIIAALHRQPIASADARSAAWPG